MNCIRPLASQASNLVQQEHDVPIYYFHVRKGERLLTDDQGMELPDIEEAKAEARRTAGEMLRDGTISHGEILEVTDAEKHVVLRFKCADLEVVESN